LCKRLIGGIKNWQQGLYDLTDAVGKAFALSQIVWETDGNVWYPDRLLRWPQRETMLGDPMQWYAQDQDDVRVVTSKALYEGEPLKQYQWMLHIQKAWSQPLAKAALFRAIVWYFLFKNLSWKAWLIFLERYGNPLRLGKFGAGAGEDDKAVIIEALEQLGIDSYAMIPEKSTIEIVESQRGTNELPHPPLINHCNSEISKAIMGSTMAVDPGTKGARSQGEVYERSELEQTTMDCLNLAETIRNQLCEPIVRFNLGSEYPIPDVSFLLQKESNLLQRAQLDKILINELGLPVSKRFLYQMYGVPVPREGEELINEGGIGDRTS
jgi:phage gp29-like protein